jgi:hypothetical protein
MAIMCYINSECLVTHRVKREDCQSSETGSSPVRGARKLNADRITFTENKHLIIFC